MKKLILIGAIGVCSLVIGATVIASESPLSPKGTAISEQEMLKSNEESDENLISLNNMRPPVILVKVTSNPTEAPLDTTAVQDNTSSNDDKQNTEVKTTTYTASKDTSYNNDNPSSGTIGSATIQQEEIPVVEQPETIVNNTPETNVPQTSYDTGNCPYFIDENHDGFCDNGDVHYHNGTHIDENCDGYCDYGDHYCMGNSYSNNNCYSNDTGVCNNYDTSHRNQHHNNNAYSSENTNNNSGGGSHHSGRHHR